MRKIAVLIASLFIAGTTMAQNVGERTVTVNCATPRGMAGGVTVSLSGSLEIVVSPTTGMTKVKTGSELELTVNRETSKIMVQGIYLSTTNHEYIDGTVDEDMSPFSTLLIDFKDSSTSARSFIQRVNGDRLPLMCSH